MRAFGSAFLALALLSAPPLHEEARAQAGPAVQPITGVVRDSGGGVVQRATIIARLASGAERRAVTDAEGRFTITPPAAGDVTLIVRVDGFAESRRTIPSGARAATVEIVVEPAGVIDTVTVTPTRSEQRMGDVPASVNVLNREQIRQSPAIAADDVLRQIPTFSLFRRSSSISAHPTSQGVSLRGIAPSGVSRTLVLLDGIPYNDAFGGWVYWTGLPIEGAERIEVVDGASSSLYGTYAMGGVINIMTAAPSRRTLELRTQYGNRSSPKLDFRGSDVWGKLGVAVDGSLFDTDGYAPVAPDERGPVDNNAAVLFRNLSVKANYDVNDRVHLFVRTGYFREERDNGKMSTFAPLTEEANDTTWKYTSGGLKWRLPDSSDLQATIFTDFKTFRSNFMAVPPATPARSVGRFTLNQRVPSRAVGGALQWSRAFAGMHLVTAGGDWRWVDGDSEEDGLDGNTGTTVVRRRVSGGTQRNIGLFVQDLITPRPDLTLTVSARVDRWRNYDGHNTLTDLVTGAVTDPALPVKQDTAISPRVGALYRVNSRVAIWGDIGTGFRAPTLNELYRQFQLGTTLTLANAELGPERLVGGEAGISIIPVNNLTVRTTWYDNRVEDPVANVTINVTPALITQRRQNLGRSRIWGVQSDAEYRVGSFWRLSGAYLYGQARVKEAAIAELADNCPGAAAAGRPGESCFLQQVPKHRGSVQVAYSNPRLLSFMLDVQATGRQFDDDRNERIVPGESEPGLPKYAIVSLFASRAVARDVEVFLAAQNLFDQEYFVGTLPTLVGPPRLVSVGVRVRLQGN
jgi:outer membrane receptor protein involved in Fe transport